jgi:hypothetical protein
VQQPEWKRHPKRVPFSLAGIFGFGGGLCRYGASWLRLSRMRRKSGLRVMSMLQRVKRLEAARAAPRSTFEVTYDSFGAFEEQFLALVDGGKLTGAT